ncbi:DUF2628 domain-containing protein [Oricola cellulosilytica]|uniref:DUF2628 domain-containing protein n=1 Tax=Oricola cellulosilytica TaxID=1429082 RepID=A0A4R0PGG5_9HYPH|nr:DUF2628 domain-containing protein [Oricola cellulosilytica]TCD16003.1 DUF2628 domain-containing protein [Oricola cellulosilytica]
MANFVIMERQRPAGGTVDTVMIRDDLAVLAVIFPLFWLLWHRLWFAALGLLLVTVALALAGEILKSDLALVLAGLVVGVFVALEGPAMRMGRYRREGYRDAGAVQAPDLSEAEMRWFARRRPKANALIAVPAVANVTRPVDDSDVMFGFSGDTGS